MIPTYNVLCRWRATSLFTFLLQRLVRYCASPPSFPSLRRPPLLGARIQGPNGKLSGVLPDGNDVSPAEGIDCLYRRDDKATWKELNLASGAHAEPMHPVLQGVSQNVGLQAVSK